MSLIPKLAFNLLVRCGSTLMLSWIDWSAQEIKSLIAPVFWILADSFILTHHQRSIQRLLKLRHLIIKCLLHIGKRNTATFNAIAYLFLTFASIKALIRTFKIGFLESKIDMVLNRGEVSLSSNIHFFQFLPQVSGKRFALHLLQSDPSDTHNQQWGQQP